MEGPGPTCHLPDEGSPGGLQVGQDGAASLQGADEPRSRAPLLLQLLLVLAEPLPRAGWVQGSGAAPWSCLVVVAWGGPQTGGQRPPASAARPAGCPPPISRHAEAAREPPL